LVETEARDLGIPPVQFNVIGESELQVKEGYLGLVIEYAGQSKTIPFVDRPEDLEYRLLSMIRDLTRTERPVVALADADQGPGGGPESSYSHLETALGEAYAVRPLSLSDTAPIADDVRVIVLTGSPFVVNDTLTGRVQAFLKRGGGALVLASGMTIEQQGFLASARPVGWNAVLAPYGLTVRSDMVYDLASNERVAFSVPGGRLLMSYPFWLRSLSTRTSPVNRDIEALLLPWASSVDTAAAPAGTVTPLFVTSRAGGRESGRAFISPQRDYPQDSLAVQLVAALANPLAADSVGEFRGRVVVIGNSTFASDAYADQGSPGLVVVSNAVDWLAQDDALIQIRSKDRRPPPLVFESKTTRDAVKYGNLVGLPILLVAFAGVRLYRRRRRGRGKYEFKTENGA
jgi:ABC-type uncharacterized transport system involved in gliding motility auxiliary subunit